MIYHLGHLNPSLREAVFVQRNLEAHTTSAMSSKQCVKLLREGQTINTLIVAAVILQ